MSDAVAQGNEAPADDEVVVARPEDYRVLIDIQHAEKACAGAAAGFLLRSIAYRAGSYAPGIQEVMFFELQSERYGGTIESVAKWFAARGGDLSALGYRVQARRVTHQTDGILSWVTEGKGFRGAVLPTDYRTLHPNGATTYVPHAVAITVDRADPRSADSLIQVDPWPGIGGTSPANGAGNGRPTGTANPSSRSSIAPNLAAAHRTCRYAALIVFWSGYS